MELQSVSLSFGILVPTLQSSLPNSRNHHKTLISTMLWLTDIPQFWCEQWQMMTGNSVSALLSILNVMKILSDRVEVLTAVTETMKTSTLSSTIKT
jgi:hypothetical protein